MNIEKEKFFVESYIIKKRKERILYELSKPSKRLDAIGRFCHDYDMYIDERKMIYSGKDITDEMLVEFVKIYGDEKEGYIICWDEEYDMMSMDIYSAIPIIRDDCMCMIFISGNVCIVSTEQTYGAKDILVLSNKR